MTKIFQKIFLLVLSICFINTCFALQTKPIVDNGTISAFVSIKGLTRIAVANDRITNIRGPSSAYNIQNDNNQGAVFIQPTPNSSNQPFTVFIATEQNHNYVLRLTPRDQPADTILLKPKDSQNPIADHWEKTTPYTQAITQLFTDMANQSSPEGYAVNNVTGMRKHYLGSIVNYDLIQVYVGANLEGQVYKVTNRTGSTITLSESEFYESGDRAIALSNLIINPYGNAMLYKVVSHG